MILTTTPTVEGRTISEYMRVIGGETVIGINLYRSMSAGYNRPVEIAQARDAVRLRLPVLAHALGQMIQLQMKFLHRLVDLAEPFRPDLPEQPPLFIVRIRRIERHPALLGVNLQKRRLRGPEAA